MPQITCKIRRKGGTRVEFNDGGSYHFKPAADALDGDHVAEVSNEAHVARFRAIPEAYVVPGEVMKAAEDKTDLKEEVKDETDGEAKAEDAPKAKSSAKAPVATVKK